jgi:hypothetical protein
MSTTSRIVLGLAFIVCVCTLAWWLMRIALRPPTGFWAVDQLSPDPEDPEADRVGLADDPPRR